MTSLMVFLLCGAVGALISGGLAWRSHRLWVQGGENSTDFAERVSTKYVNEAWKSSGLYEMEIFFASVFGAAAGGFVGLLASAVMEGVR